MGKALSPLPKFQSDSIGGRAPQSFRSGVVAPEHGLLALHGGAAAANESFQPLSDDAVAEQEDAFWRDSFAHERYYVPGRSYDQYRPAYALGWQAAFNRPIARFSELEPELERYWESHDTSSLLDWAQVREAVLAAWLRGRASVSQKLPVASAVHCSHILRPLRRKQLQLSQELAFLLEQVDPPPSAFMRQVMDRHVQMLREFMLELPEDVGGAMSAAEPFQRIASSAQQVWWRLCAKVLDVDMARVLQFCEQHELAMLAQYRKLLQEAISPELDSVLQRQMHRLRLHHAKLQWVRQHWLERG